MKIETIAQLLEKARSGQCSAKEEKALKAWLHLYNMEGSNDLTDQDYLNARTNMLKAINSARFPLARKIRLWPRIAVAAAIAIVFFGGGLFYYKLNINQKHTDKFAKINDVAPGKHGATLTLASGKTIRLADASNGELAKEAGVVITKSANGELIYETKGSEAESNKTNTLSTAKGQTYQLRLPDGSLVWLNAASSLTYSTSLKERGEERSVFLSGEAYFQVAKDKTRPFVVKTATQQVKVLGTHFNVNSYADEGKVVTTLAEGSVEVELASGKVSTKGMVMLKPGQQSVNRNQLIRVEQADLEAALAWKNNRIYFKDATIEQILRQASRWYDVQVEYKSKPGEELFTGGIDRDSNLSALLKLLQLSEVKFSITDVSGVKKLIVE